jgi:hypothetical protein
MAMPESDVVTRHNRVVVGEGNLNFPRMLQEGLYILWETLDLVPPKG